MAGFVGVRVDESIKTALEAQAAKRGVSLNKLLGDVLVEQAQGQATNPKETIARAENRERARGAVARTSRSLVAVCEEIDALVKVRDGLAAEVGSLRQGQADSVRPMLSWLIGESDDERRLRELEQQLLDAEAKIREARKAVLGSTRPSKESRTKREPFWFGDPDPSVDPRGAKQDNDEDDDDQDDDDQDDDVLADAAPSCPSCRVKAKKGRCPKCGARSDGGGRWTWSARDDDEQPTKNGKKNGNGKTGESTWCARCGDWIPNVMLRDGEEPLFSDEPRERLCPKGHAV